ncbi:hypothetical protein ABT023_22140 [Micromonospora sp. NPDC002296]|uniref:hypothetical protein n=1 Tax=Micromonospora sp. NPDC002296 TaxID=3154271 RepID=UPI00332EE42E
MSHRGGRHRAYRGRHCACQVCGETRAGKERREPRTEPEPKTEPKPARYDPPLVGPMIPPLRVPRNDAEMQVRWSLAGEPRGRTETWHGNGGRW